MWDIRRQAISTYVATSPRHGVGTSQGHSDGGFAVVRQRVELDHAMLDSVARDLGDLLKFGLRALVALPVHYDTVASAATRMECLRRIRDLPEETRRHLIVEFIDLPKGVPGVRMLDLTAGIRQLCRSIIVQVPPADAPFAILRDAGIRVCGVRLPGRPNDETRTINQLNAFMAAAQKARFETYLQGSSSLSLTAAAVAAGFTYIAGDPVASPAAGLKMVARYGLEDLYIRMLGGQP